MAKNASAAATHVSQPMQSQALPHPGPLGVDPMNNATMAQQQTIKPLVARAEEAKINKAIDGEHFVLTSGEYKIIN